MRKTILKERIREYFVKHAAEISCGIALMNGNSNWYKICRLLKR